MIVVQGCSHVSEPGLRFRVLESRFDRGLRSVVATTSWEVSATMLTEQEKVRVDGARIAFGAAISETLTSFAAGIAGDGENGPPDTIYSAFERLTPGDVTPEAEEGMLRFMLVRLRLAEEFGFYEEAQRTAFAARKWGVSPSEIFDAMTGVELYWAGGPWLPIYGFPGGVDGAPRMRVKVRRARA